MGWQAEAVEVLFLVVGYLLWASLGQGEPSMLLLLQCLCALQLFARVPCRSRCCRFCKQRRQIQRSHGASCCLSGMLGALEVDRSTITFYALDSRVTSGVTLGDGCCIHTVVY